MRIFIPLVVLSSIAFFSFKGKNVPHCKFSFDHFSALKNIPEPSDIVYDKESGHYFIVSDHGMLFECDLAGKIIRKAPAEGRDFEGVEVKDSFIYVSDETPRMVYKYRKNDLSLVRTFEVSWGGATNKAFESISYNYARKCFVMVSEQPVVIVEFDDQFRQQGRYAFHGARDMSGARWHDGSLYLLSSLDETIFKCDPNTYEVKEKYKINVLNPEGIAFNGNNDVTVTSDDLQRIYFFKNIPAIK